MQTFIQREPVLVIGLLVTMVETAIALGVSFGLGFTPDQVGTIMAFVIATGNLMATLISRSQVTPVSNPRLTTPPQ
jgi:hypothetical protein